MAMIGSSDPEEKARYERRFAERLSNEEFAMLVDRIARSAKSRSLWACELLYQRLSVEQSDTRRIALMRAMVENSCLSCPIDVLVKLASVQHPNVSELASGLLVLGGQVGERALILELPKVRGDTLATCIGALRFGSGPVDIATVGKYTNHPNKFVRIGALGILGMRGDPTCTPNLTEALIRRDRRTRETVLKALGSVGDARAVDQILDCLRVDAARKSNPDTRFIEYELNYIAQHSRERPDAFSDARAIMAQHWKKRDSEEIFWIEHYLPQVSRESPDTTEPLSPENIAILKSQIIKHLRDGFYFFFL